MRKTIPDLTHGELDRLFHAWPLVMRKATDTWAIEFACSIWEQSARKNWKPSLRQLKVMRTMVRELLTSDDLGDEDDILLIE